MKIAVCAVAIGEEYNKKFWVRFAKENHIAYCNISKNIGKYNGVTNSQASTH